ncbi:hypothetical protein C8R44DRAFT_808305 [Mycena epipterygia]|nr:hypothetical protein C8R44DRAFT_808305 [Mycena epipterygia]
MTHHGDPCPCLRPIKSHGRSLLFIRCSFSFHDTTIHPSSTTMKFALTHVLALVAAAVHAMPLTTLETRDVFTPPVTYPHAGTVWFVGQTHNVTWDTSDAPVNITNKIGFIMLRKGGLTTPVILQENFSILLGRIEVKVPWVEDGDDYELVLFGDSGNFSPVFTINGA